MQHECDEMETELQRRAQETLALKNKYHECNINYYRRFVTVIGVFSKSKLFARQPTLHPHDAWCIASMHSEHFTINYASPQLLKMLKYNEICVMRGLAVFRLRGVLPQACILNFCLFLTIFRATKFISIRSLLAIMAAQHAV